MGSKNKIKINKKWSGVNGIWIHPAMVVHGMTISYV